MAKFLKAANALFGHKQRYNIAIVLRGSPKSFSELKGMFNLTAPTLDFHLKLLKKGLIIEQMEPRGNYSLTVVGESLLIYFTKWIHHLQQVMKLVK